MKHENNSEQLIIFYHLSLIYLYLNIFLYISNKTS